MSRSIHRALVPAILCAGLAAPAVAQQDAAGGPRIQMDLPGGTVAVDCGRTSISDCAAAIRPLVDLATQAARNAPATPRAPATGQGTPAPAPATPDAPAAGAGAIRPGDDAAAPGG